MVLKGKTLSPMPLLVVVPLFCFGCIKELTLGVASCLDRALLLTPPVWVCRAAAAAADAFCVCSVLLLQRGDAKAKLAVTDSGSGTIHIYDLRRWGPCPAATFKSSALLLCDVAAWCLAWCGLHARVSPHQAAPADDLFVLFCHAATPAVPAQGVRCFPVSRLHVHRGPLQMCCCP